MEVELATQFIETICSECVIRIDVGDSDYPYVGVRLLQGHPPAGGLRYRLREAWSVFMGRGADWWEFYSQDEINRFVAALEKAKPTIPLPPPIAYTTGGLVGAESVVFPRRLLRSQSLSLSASRDSFQSGEHNAGQLAQ